MSARGYTELALVAASAPPIPLPPPPPPGGFHRRSALLGGFAAVLAAPLLEAAGQSHPDAELIGLCRQYGALVDRINAAFSAMPDDYTWEQERAYDAIHSDPLYEQKATLMKRIEKIPARTLDGLRARVEMLVKESPYLLEPRGGLDETMISDVLKDVLALTGGTV